MTTENLTLHTDKYQINMMYAHWIQGSHNNKAVFELYFRKLPFGNGYAVFAGLQRVIEYLQQLRFSEDLIEFLKEQEENYEEGFFEELRQFSFTGHLYSVPEGTLVFANEPLIRVEARNFEAHLIETAILNFVNYQTLIATKASRIKQVAPNEVLLEFGTRRAQEADAAVWGARASYIAGFHATSNVRAGMMFGIPAKGTHAHAWIQAHEGEEEAFRKYAEALPNQVTLLVDTYDTLKSGVPNAIKIGKWMELQGKRINAIRLDSGDLAYLSKMSRQMLDHAGLTYVKIVATNDLDENIILNLKAQGAQIDIWGVGTHLITGGEQSSLGGVYKIVAREVDGGYVPVIKISGNPEKVSTPGIKMLYRIVNKQSGKAEVDYVAFPDEENIRNGERIKLFDPVHPYLHRFIDNYEAVPLLKTIVENGNLVYDLPSLDQIRSYHETQIELLWPEYLRKLNPEVYHVDLSEQVWHLKMEMIQRYKG